MQPAMGWAELARRLATDPDDPAALRALGTPPSLPEIPPPPDPPGLAGPAAPEPPATWHARRLIRGCADPLARRYHAVWLRHLLAPDEPAARPVVTVMMTAYNSGQMIRRALDSALAQDWPAVEMLVVDDGSTDDTPAILAGYGDRIRVVTLPVNRGIAAARDTGLKAASGDYIHFLDCDDVLLPGCLSAKVAAFAARPQAGLCFADYRRAGTPEAPAGDGWWVPVGAPHCASRAPAYGLIGRFLIMPSCVMVARHLALAAGGFDPRLRQHDDRHFFGRLGLAGTLCIGLDRPLSWLERRADSLSRKPDVGLYGVLASLLLLNELIERPDLWPVARGPVAVAFWGGTWARFEAERPAEQLALFERLLDGLEALAKGRVCSGYAPAPLAAELADSLAAIRADEPWQGPLSERLDAALARCLEARAPGPNDLALWREGSFDPAYNAPAFRLLFRQLGRDIRAGRPWMPLAELDRRPFRAIPHPARRRWRSLARLARRFGEGGVVRWLARRLA